MKIMVFDVPASSGGALTILKQYYSEAINDIENEWIFVISTPDLVDAKNVKILKYPWVKKSWFHRLYFDRFIAHKLVEKYNVDEVLSLQNVIIPKIKLRQTLYLHQSLPFVEKKYRATENFKFWIYQTIISEMIYKSIQKADKVIVQTKWVMYAAMKKAKVSKDKFILKQPELNIEIKRVYEERVGGEKLFFYPAGGSAYKNHEIIVKACRQLKNQGVDNYKVIFTLMGNENKHIKVLREIIMNKDLPIEFIGTISLDEVYNYYSKSILIFPSYIETFGLPLLEAKMHGCPILASDCAFSHEILDDYDKVRFFNPFNYVCLYELMKKIITEKFALC